jgi:hypothetical protein
LALIALIVCVASDAAAQTDYSLRMRTLGLGLSGIVDDPYNDAFLNPARVGDLSARRLYAARLPDRVLSTVLPDQIYYYEDEGVFPPEQPPGDPYELRRSYTPYMVGFVSPLGSSLTGSFTAEIAVKGDDYLVDDNQLWVDASPGYENFEYDDVANGREERFSHAVFDMAFGTGDPESEKRRFGMRLTAGYDKIDDGRFQSRLSIDPPYADISQIVARYRYERASAEFEAFNLFATLGMYAPRSFLRQLVVGVGAGWEQHENNPLNLQVDDDDYDGDGLDPDGDPARYYVERDEFQSARNYDGGSVFARLGLSWTRRIRSFHRFSWSRSSGDGDAVYRDRTQNTQYYTNISGERFEYGYDGTIETFQMSNAVGFFEELREDLLFALGLQAVLVYQEFDETGTGTGSWETINDAGSTTTSAPYEQQMTLDTEIWRLQLPASVDWEINRYVSWRFGVVFEAYREDTDRLVSRDLELTDVPDMGLLPVSDRVHERDYTTTTYMNNGLGIELWDRVGIQLFASFTAYANLASYSSALIDFRF